MKARISTRTAFHKTYNIPVVTSNNSLKPHAPWWSWSWVYHNRALCILVVVFRYYFFACVLYHDCVHHLLNCSRQNRNS